ncbi:hemerythrin domain-containing protein [Altererythrobacter salegens]|uniref:Hemerythrin domain-containing protein n=1 Tax=Croceibacterium salegens TaxID=1737568 RepID=A0A6I4T0D1_9SPHN|nr:hemerythrin domain-containing protein [Croceibacterium salegens]MXO60072.1 hemerythrin domain-containing protein [Croceibacterium salegens]
MTEDADIFARLKQDHERHRDLLDRLAQTHGETAERRELFEEFTLEAKAHAAAEEQALYSTMMRKPPATDETRHSVAEHHEIEEMLNDLAATGMATGAWLAKFKNLEERYRHHIDEEEDEHFPDFEKMLTDEDRAFMRSVFERRKRAEKADAEVTPEKMDEANE